MLVWMHVHSLSSYLIYHGYWMPCKRMMQVYWQSCSTATPISHATAPWSSSAILHHTFSLCIKVHPICSRNKSIWWGVHIYPLYIIVRGGIVEGYLLCMVTFMSYCNPNIPWHCILKPVIFDPCFE